MMHVNFRDSRATRGASLRPKVVLRYQMAIWFVSVIGTEGSPLRRVSVTIR